MAMAFKWLIHSACHVLGYPNDTVSQIHHADGDLKSLKVSTSNGVAVKNNINHDEQFQMPLHYPRYTKADYEKMEEWKVDMLLKQYGIANIQGSLDEKRAFAMGAFLWPDQY
ncbi:uncharacterized protein LOC107415338 [Ziziphus jujuba]|uniref:Uncharacterized protein LOC107415338 n=1 Tax=Ziziphus jujuba TaxID=326968 RepID=A0A6P3ZKK1_ZIZJJ|nr:uncharacterized protein LOC107415338 [Ziziphus jujuba]